MQGEVKLISGLCRSDSSRYKSCSIIRREVYRGLIDDRRRDKQTYGVDLKGREKFTVVLNDGENLISPVQLISSLIAALTSIETVAARFLSLALSVSEVSGDEKEDKGFKIRRIKKRLLKNYRELASSLCCLKSLASRPVSSQKPLIIAIRENDAPGRVLPGEYHFESSQRPLNSCPKHNRIASGDRGQYGPAVSSSLLKQVEYLRDVGHVSLLASASAERMMTLFRDNLDFIVGVSTDKGRLTSILFDLVYFNTELAAVVGYMKSVRCIITEYDAQCYKHCPNPKAFVTLAHKALNTFAELLNLLECECYRGDKSAEPGIKKVLQRASRSSIKVIERLRPIVTYSSTLEGGSHVSPMQRSLLIDATKNFVISIIRVIYTINPSRSGCEQCFKVSRVLSRLRKTAVLIHRITSTFSIDK